ncbi:MAG: YihY/virulence factor BrkB family protein [Actinobacteria bacterium]|nr:YihY/virulence factor BrkB family protein [Actinomycetota bacterium]MCA1721892.1 YihY/virulence factor BrkB family protein [Actinomycetota bacterium]
MTSPSAALTEESDRRSAEARAAATRAEAARPTPGSPVRWFVRTVADVIRKSDRDRALGLAAENAFMAVLTVFPTLLVVAAILGQLGLIIGEGNATRVENSVLDFLGRLLTDQADGALSTARGLFRTGGNTLTLASVLALVSLAQAFAGVINTVTLVYDVHDRRGWWKRRGLGLVVGLGSALTGAVVVTLVVVGPLFGRGVDVVTRIGLGSEYQFLWSYLRWPVAVVSLVLWATTLFHICPDRQGTWRQGLPGGLLTAVFWLAASVGFNVYLELVVRSSPVLGALGGGLILMTWFYLLCLGLLVGAELNAILLARRAARATP